MEQLNEILLELGVLLPQLERFTHQFHNTVTEYGISVATDASGNMNVDVPQDMADNVANKVSTRIGVIDRLINTRRQEISKLLEDGISLEQKIKLENPNHQSYLADKIREFKKLNESYKH